MKTDRRSFLKGAAAAAAGAALPTQLNASQVPEITGKELRHYSVGGRTIDVYGGDIQPWMKPHIEWALKWEKFNTLHIDHKNFALEYLWVRKRKDKRGILNWIRLGYTLKS